MLDGVGDTPLVRLRAPELANVELYAKLEFTNPTGSVKDRAAKYVLDALTASGRLGPGSLVVESSSGNMGISLGAACARRGMRFRCVIDPRISRTNEMLMRTLGVELVQVTDLDPTGGYLQTRLQKVREILDAEPGAYWVNQYGNALNAEAYSKTLAAELLEDLERLDYVFVGVSSAGTITGISRRIKEARPSCKVVAVDTEGSVIFGGPPLPRWLQGIGASVVPPMLKDARIDDVAIATEEQSVRACLDLWRDHNLFVGGSSGCAFAAIRAYFANKTFDRPPVVAMLFADRGDRYADTIFNPEWAEKLFDGTLRRSVSPPAAAPAANDETPWTFR